MSHPLQSDNQRQLDLIRFCRHELHTQGLITDTEYSDLMQMSGAVARLESYDEVRAKAARERERCAQVAESAKKADTENDDTSEYTLGVDTTATWIANMIRSGKA